MKKIQSDFPDGRLRHRNLACSSMLLFVFFGLAVPAYAIEANGVAMGGGVTVYPDFSFKVFNDDNAYLQPDETREEVTLSTYTPGVSLEGDFGQYLFSAGYKMQKGVYNNSDDDNYLDHMLDAKMLFDVGTRDELDLRASFKAGHDARGSGTVEGASALGIKYPDEYNEMNIRSTYTHGADRAFANVSGRLLGYQKKYKNNFEAGTRDRDHQKIGVGITSAFAISSDSGILVDLSMTDISYDNDTTASDNREGSILRGLVGAGWDITGKTSGSVKAGVTRRGFDNDDIDADVSLSWEANLLWSPKEYSTFRLSTAQAANETSGPGFYVDSTITQISWDHTISTFYSIGAVLSYLTDDYYNETNDRKDNISSIGVSGDYSPTENSEIGVSYKFANRDSSVSGLDYSQNVVSLSVRFAI